MNFKNLGLLSSGILSRIVFCVKGAMHNTYVPICKWFESQSIFQIPGITFANILATTRPCFTHF